MRSLRCIIFLFLFIPVKSAHGQSFADQLKKIDSSTSYSIDSEGRLGLYRNNAFEVVGAGHAKKVNCLGVALPVDYQLAQLDLSAYPNLKFLFLGLEYNPSNQPDYNGRLHFDGNVQFSGGIGFIPYLWPTGLSSDTNLLLISIDKACAYSDCESSVILSLPSDLINNKNIRWFDADNLSIHYIPESIDQWEKLEVFALNHEGELPFIPLNLFRCQRLSFLCLSERNMDRPELVFLRKMHRKGDKIEMRNTYDSGDIGWGDEYPYRLSSNMHLKTIELTKRVEIHAADKKQLIVSGQLTNGLLEGKWEMWHPNGKPAQERYYIHGKETGIWRAWDTTGFLKAEYFFSDTGRTEISFFQYPDGQTKINTLNYNLAGLAHGKWSIEIKAPRQLSVAEEHTYMYLEQNYTNGQQQGISYYKFEDGTGQEFLMKDGRVISKKDY